MITSIDILPDQKALVNKLITVWWEQGKIKAAHDKRVISTDDALDLVQEYVSELEESLP